MSARVMVKGLLDRVVHRIPTAAHRAERLGVTIAGATLDTGGQRDWAIDRGDDIGDGDRRERTGKTIASVGAAL